jgi:hypothetical protein
MRLTRPHPGGATLLWLGVLGAPFAWTVQHVSGYALTEANCGTAGRTTWEVHMDAWTIVVTALAVTVALAALTAAVATFRAVRDSGTDPPGGRIRFLSVIGIAIAPLFLAMILMSGLGVLMLNPCVQG